MKRVLNYLLVLGVVVTTHAGQPLVSVSDARLRWLPNDLPMAGYFVITSHAPGPLRLTGVTSSAFDHVMLHRSIEEGGKQRMVHVDGVDLAPDGSVTFAPGGYHLMLMHRTQALHVGEVVPVILKLSDGQTLKIDFRVVGAQSE